MSADKKDGRTATERERAQQEHNASVLWHLGIRTLEALQTGAQSLMMPLPGSSLEASSVRNTTLQERATLAGVFAMLVQAKRSDIAGGLRLKLVQEWGPDLVLGGPVPLTAYIAWVDKPRELVPRLPRLDMYGWAALHGLVTDGPNRMHMLTLMSRTSRREHELAPLIEALRGKRIVQDLMQPA